MSICLCAADHETFLPIIDEFELNRRNLYFSPGGMQDWNYLNTNCFEVTLELGCVKYPMAKELPKYWEQNRRALLQFMQQVIPGSSLNITLSSLPHFHSVLHLLTCMWLCVFVGPQWNKRHSLRHTG